MLWASYFNGKVFCLPLNLWLKWALFTQGNCERNKSVRITHFFRVIRIYKERCLYIYFFFIITGWFWLPETTVLPGDRCVSPVLQCCDSHLLSQCGWEMGARNSQTLSQSSNCSSRHTVWSAKWRESVDRAGSLQGRASASRWGTANGREHRSNLYGVFGSHPEKLEGSVW